MKKCSKCKTKKPTDQFYSYFRKGEVRLQARCKSCVNDYNRKWRSENKESIAEYNRKYKKSGVRNKWKEMLSNAKKRAKLKGLPFDLEFDDLQRPMKCPVFGTPIDYSNGPATDNTPSLDRIVPELGYVKGNVVIISNKANRMKNDATLRQCVLLGEWAKKILEDKE